MTKYDYNNQSCVIEESFCKSKNFDFINATKDCKIVVDDNFGYNIFGEKIINQMIESDVSTKYKSCKPNEIDSSNVSMNFKKILDESPKYLVPYNIPSIIYKINSKKSCIEEKQCKPTQKLKNGICTEDCKNGYIEDKDTCFKKYGGFDTERFADVSPSQEMPPPPSQEMPDPPSQEMPDPPGAKPEQEEVSKLKLLPKIISKRIVSNKPISTHYCPPNTIKESSLCYEKCKDGFKSDGAITCWKQYPGFEGNSGNTITSITKRSRLNTGVIGSVCPPDKTKENSLCYDKCRPGFSSDGATQCYKDAPSNWPGTTSLTHLQHKTHYTGPGKPLTDCRPDQEKGGALCYPKCRPGFSSDGAAICYRQAPPNWPGSQSLTHLQHKTHYTGPGKPLTDCRPDQEKGGALCYPKCRPGFSSDGAAMCYRQAPQNWPGSQTVTHLQHRTHYTGPGKPLTDCRSDQEKNGALCYPRCNSGYYGAGPVCWQYCASDEVDNGLFCMKKCRPGYDLRAGVCWIQSHNRGVGTAVELEDCPSGWHNDGLTCREPLKTVDNGYYNWSWGKWGCHSGKSGCNFWGCSRCYKTWIVRLHTTGGRVVGRLNNGGKCSGDRYKTEGMCYRRCPADKPVGRGFLCYANEINSIGMSYVPASRSKPSYGRGGGEPLKCAPGLEQRGALCYENCSRFNSNGVEYERRGDNIDFCSTKCPPGFTNIGIGGCQRESYGRGAGEPLKCAPGLEQRGALCYIDCSKYNSNGVEYERRGDNIDFCSTKCPPGAKNIGIGGCQKEAYNRGVGKPMDCRPDQEKHAGLCYNKCPDGFYMDPAKNIGTCFQTCPPGSTDFGVGCTREKHPRAVGKPLGCAPNETQRGAFCYQNCPAGTTLKQDGNCTSDCPPGTRDVGNNCERESYNKEPGLLPYSVSIKERIEPYIIKKVNPETI
jgi:hypothetical protein